MVKSISILAAVTALAAAQPAPAPDMQSGIDLASTAQPVAGNNGISGAVFTTVYTPTPYAYNVAKGYGAYTSTRPKYEACPGSNDPAQCISPAETCPGASAKDLEFDNMIPTTVCYNGGIDTAGQVNCNIYRRMSDVWLSGGPRGNQPALEDGNYFFAILQPGGQHDPRDFTLNNLSDMCSADRKGNPSCPSTTARNTKAQEEASGDRWFERMFKVEGGQGQITAVGPSVAFDMYGNQTGYRALTLAPRCTHDYILPKDNVDGSTVDPAARYGLIRAATYDPSLNPGGVHILAVCRAPKQFSFGDVPSPTDLNPSSDCKYDAFKVMNTGGNVVPPEPSPLTVTVTASRYYNQQITWTIEKKVTANGKTSAIEKVRTMRNTIDATGLVNNYTVGVNGAVDSSTKLFTGVIKGNVTVTHDNGHTITASSITINVTAGGSGSGVCSLDGMPPLDLPSGLDGATFPYTCTGVTTAASPTPSVVATVHYTADSSATWRTASNNPAITPTDVPTGIFLHDQICVTDAMVYKDLVLNTQTSVGTIRTLGSLKFVNSAVQEVRDSICTRPAGVVFTISGTQATFTYIPVSNSITARNTAQAGCQDQYINTANGTTSTTSTAIQPPPTPIVIQARANVTVCTPGSVGGHTMGYWQNPNGQHLLTAFCNSTFVDQLRTWKLLAVDSDSTVACSGGDMTLAAAVTRTIEVATGDKNVNNQGEDMLRGQMLATTLSAYYGMLCAYYGDDALVRGPPALSMDQEVQLVSLGAYDFSAAFPDIQGNTIRQYIGYVASHNYYADWQNLVTIRNLAKDLFDYVNNGWTYDEKIPGCPLTQ